MKMKMKREVNERENCFLPARKPDTQDCTYFHGENSQYFGASNKSKPDPHAQNEFKLESYHLEVTSVVENERIPSSNQVVYLKEKHFHCFFFFFSFSSLLQLV